MAAEEHISASDVKNNMKRTLVVLTGWARDGHSYQKLIKSAANGWHVLIPRYRELGLQKGILEFEKNLLSLIKSQKPPVSLLGHSLGGALAIGFSSKYPDMVKELFLIDSKGVRHNGSLLDEILTLLEEYKKKTLLEHFRYFAGMLRNPIVYIKSGLIAHYADLEKEARLIRAKTTIFWGENDTVTPLAHGKKIKENIQNSRLIVFRDLGHDWILHTPEKFWKEIES